MNDGVKLSKKHGVNPTLCKCFFCGETKHIALLGELPNDEEAPRECIMDYEPCDECQKKMELGVTLISVTDEQQPDGRPPINKNHMIYPTGGWAVLKVEAFREMFDHKEEELPRCCFLDYRVFEDIMKHSSED